MKRKIFVTSICLLLCSGCATFGEPVKPWQKGNLARPDMALELDPHDARLVEHTYVSMEAAFGGMGVGGGGCGCN
jgi:hypothetical protein